MILTDRLEWDSAHEALEVDGFLKHVLQLSLHVFI